MNIRALIFALLCFVLQIVAFVYGQTAGGCAYGAAVLVIIALARGEQ